MVVVVACGSSSATSPEGEEGTPASNDAGTAPHDGDTNGRQLPTVGEGLGPATFTESELDAPSNGGTITYQNIGAPGWYPRLNDPAVGPCDVKQEGTCCLGKHDVTGNALTPWDQDLILTLRGPLTLKQLAVYQPGASDDVWQLVSSWDERLKNAPRGLAFSGNATDGAPFAGAVGSECLVDVSSDSMFTCGAGSSPYCPPPFDGALRYHGFSGSKLFVLLARMPHAPDVAGACSNGATTGNWYDAPWLGLSVGELIRAGAFSSCHCYAKDPANWHLGDGCGQFNAFEVINDNNAYKNLDIFSTNMFGYAGYIGEGPCGGSCDATQWNADADLIDKSKNGEAAQGGVVTPTSSSGTALRRPIQGYRYFLIALDTTTRSVQLAIVHPKRVPPALAPLLPDLPAKLERQAIDAVLSTRLPK